MTRGPGKPFGMEALERLVAKDAIRELLFSYARGVDRCDLERLESIFWPEATDDHGFFKGNALEFAKMIVPMLTKEMHRTVHNMTNISIEFDSDDVARAETYCIALHEYDGAQGREELVVSGRYLDRVERRDGHWKIARRISLVDWNQTRASTSDWTGEHPLLGALTVGARKPDDCSYAEGW